MSTPASLIEHFSHLEDPRVERNKKHELIDVIVLCVCAVLSGAQGWSDIEEFGRSKLAWLRRYVPLANGIPVDDTIARIISALSVTGFEECFRSWMEDAVRLSRGEVVAVDGKTHRRSHDRKRGVGALPLVSAWACRNGVVLGQVKSEEKSNEITAVPELLKKLARSGAIVTIDAMGCQREIARQIKESGADYVLAVKGNQGTLEEAVREYFETGREMGFKGMAVQSAQTLDGEHGRVEQRRYWLSTDLCTLPAPQQWRDLKAIGWVESERHCRGKISTESRYFITSIDDVEAFREAVRSHWGIENELHWRMDVTFREDESRIRRGNAPHNLGVIRHVAVNLLKREPSKLSVRKKRLRAALNDSYRDKVLMAQ